MVTKKGGNSQDANKGGLFWLLRRDRKLGNADDFEEGECLGC